MAHWLTQKARALRRTPAPQPVPFERTCLCGEPVVGIRRETSQRTACRRCGEGFWVLPLDPYPPVKSPSVPPRKKSTNKQADSIADPTIPPRERRKWSVKAAASRLKQNTGSRLRKVKEASGRRIRLVIRQQREFFTPLKIVVLSIIAVVAMTGYTVFRQQQIESAKFSFREHLKDGQAAIAEARFGDAQVQLESAVDALNRLGRRDTEAEQVRQLLREADTANHLSSESLFDMLSLARQTVGSDGPSQWERKLASEFRGRWFIVESLVRSSRSPGGELQREILLPLSIFGEPVRVEAPLAAVKGMSSEEAWIPMILAVQIAECRPVEDETASRSWRLAFEPDSAYLWADFTTYEALGLLPEEPAGVDRVKQILDRQKRGLGLVVETEPTDE